MTRDRPALTYNGSTSLASCMSPATSFRSPAMEQAIFILISTFSRQMTARKRKISSCLPFRVVPVQGIKLSVLCDRKYTWAGTRLRSMDTSLLIPPGQFEMSKKPPAGWNCYSVIRFYATRTSVHITSETSFPRWSQRPREQQMISKAGSYCSEFENPFFW